MCNCSMREFAKSLIIERLPELIGEQIHVSDLPFELTQYENNTGSIWCDATRSRQFIADNISEAIEFAHNYESEFGERPCDALFEPEKFTVLFLIHVVEELICNSDAIESAMRDSDSDIVYISDELINGLSCEFENKH